MKNMRLEKKREVGLKAIYIITVLGIATWIWLDKGGSPLIYIIAVSISVPYMLDIFKEIRGVFYNPVRRLNTALPKCGFNIESKQWNEDGSKFEIVGKFKDETFLIHAYPDWEAIDIVDLPWLLVKASDPTMMYIVEAVNDLNLMRGAPRIALTQPNENGDRELLTVCSTILPPYNVEAFMTATFLNMLNYKPAFSKAMEKERPWMKKERGPIGFNA